MNAHAVRNRMVAVLSLVEDSPPPELDGPTTLAPTTLAGIAGSEHTPDELTAMCAAMQRVSSAFYPQATATGCHAFIEFCGLMNEFISICRQSAAAGVDYTRATTHGGQSLVVHEYNINYLAEKFECIFGPTLRATPGALDAFVAAIRAGGDA